MKGLLRASILLMLAYSICGCDPQSAGISGGQKMPKNDFLIVPGERAGPFTLEAATEQDLILAFGARNIKPVDIPLNEGFTLTGYLVFPGTKNELEVAYDLENDANAPAFLRFSQEDTRWKTDAGIKPGMTLQQLQEINGKPFTFSGFGWDDGGRVTDWNGGTLNAHTMIVLDNFSENAPEFIFGDLDVSSDNPDLQRLIIKVIAVEITLR